MITSWLVTSLVPCWINLAPSSGRKGPPSCLSSVVKLETCLLNLALELSESSWWRKMAWCLASNKVPFSNLATALYISGLQIVHCLNLSSSSVRPTIPLLPFTSLLSCSLHWNNLMEEKAFLVLDTTKFLSVLNLWKIKESDSCSISMFWWLTDIHWA